MLPGQLLRTQTPIGRFRTHGATTGIFDIVPIYLQIVLSTEAE